MNNPASEHIYFVCFFFLLLFNWIIYCKILIVVILQKFMNIKYLPRYHFSKSEKRKKKKTKIP